MKTTLACCLSLLSVSLLAQSSPLLMKAIVYQSYGSPEVLRLTEISKPVPTDDQLLVRVQAASVNPLDWHLMRGMPYIMRLGTGLNHPESSRLGVDFAGIVEAVGPKVTRFRVGDEVFGGKTGSFAQYLCVRENGAIVRKPDNISYEKAAAVGISGVTALQGLRDQGKLQAGQKVLINGASGGVGTFAVQIAKALGAKVTGVCSGRNAVMVTSLGAERVIDYTREDFTAGAERYDLILDMVGNRSLLACRGVLKRGGRYVMVGGPPGRWVRPLDSAVRAAVLSRLVSQHLGFFIADLNQKDLEVLRDLMEAGKVTPVIDRTYPLSQVAEAIRYSEEGHARGKVIITMASAATAATSPVPASPTIMPSVVLVEILLLIFVVPYVLATILNTRFRRRHPSLRPFLWGYYFCTQTFLTTILFGIFLEWSLPKLLLVALIYALLGWFFARRHHWAWVVLTVASLNPVNWILNSVYLWKRWSEDTRVRS